jgi:CBS domain-containing protein
MPRTAKEPLCSLRSKKSAGIIPLRGISPGLHSSDFGRRNTKRSPEKFLIKRREVELNASLLHQPCDVRSRILTPITDPTNRSPRLTFREKVDPIERSGGRTRARVIADDSAYFASFRLPRRRLAALPQSFELAQLLVQLPLRRRGPEADLESSSAHQAWVPELRSRGEMPVISHGWPRASHLLARSKAISSAGSATPQSLPFAPRSRNAAGSASDLMSARVACVRPLPMTIVEVGEITLQHRIRRLPVVRLGRQARG